MAALERAMSRERLRAYRLPGDADEADGVARYAWNLALAAALLPAMHTLEIAFRNELNRAAVKLTEKRGYRWHRVASWLDARPTMLLPHEAEKVERAKMQLGGDPRSQTEGHLIAKLDFGFWVALCRDPYADSRAAGPRLWPRALDLAFRHRPAPVTTRSQIFHQFDRVRKFRNRVAHHEPIWDRAYEAEHEHVLESLAWISPRLAEALRHTSPAQATFRAGPAAYRSCADSILGTSPGAVIIPEFKLHGVTPGHRDAAAAAGPSPRRG
ncbi:MAG TPA: hypothetical protein VFJ82_27430 [Longimicrobium sp.]|nr:hypothetical protein [Longimicrobium sp.]